MTIGIKVDFLWFSIGTGDFLHSFFSTICGNLENMKWGSKFPIVMNNLYEGEISVKDIHEAQKELRTIQEEFSKISPDKIIWDIENLEKRPPWGNNISKDIKNLSDYFVTSDGENLFDVLNEAMYEAMQENSALEVKSL
ncbi:immunity 70 family protein [Enterococcus plantarum]|uniref:immunity 70 family protein n=1 Tax=Enterococcus plantarum TaxID=1077675 RepID=UPI001A8D5D79|nr:immunity 70 family protein [Enterococcus plantarum]MBO0467043.1 immunity 70 family protein [Enterococcus plantarum]